MGRPIDADEFLQRINDEITEEIFNSTDSVYTAMLSGFRKLITTKINEQPTADVQEIKHGKWEYTDLAYTCSECKAVSFNTDYFCHNCGAKMDGEK